MLFFSCVVLVCSAETWGMGGERLGALILREHTVCDLGMQVVGSGNRGVLNAILHFDY